MDITSLIGSLGFPIVMCLLMSYYITQEMKSRKEEMEGVVKSLDVIASNIERLNDRIDNMENKKEEE